MSTQGDGGRDEREMQGFEPPVSREGSSRPPYAGRDASAPDGSAASRSAAARSSVTSRGRRLVQRLGIPLIVLIAVGVMFALQNLTRVTISFWTIKITSPLWISLYFWLIVGAIVGYVVGRAVERRPKR
jgi:uncharacterized integral membrane protein